MNDDRAGWARTLIRGFRKRCPRCGVGRVFRGWYTLEDRCGRCRLQFMANDGDTWAFMYLSTGFLTGLLIVSMFIVRPPSMLIGRATIGLAAVILVTASLPNRKGLAIAVEYLSTRPTRGETDPNGGFGADGAGDDVEAAD